MAKFKLTKDWRNLLGWVFFIAGIGGYMFNVWIAVGCWAVGLILFFWRYRMTKEK